MRDHIVELKSPSPPVQWEDGFPVLDHVGTAEELAAIFKEAIWLSRVFCQEPVCFRLQLTTMIPADQGGK